MKVDMHMHTADWSDGKAPATAMIETAIERGLDGIVITDHHVMLQPEDQQRLQRMYPRLRIFRGAEIGVNREDMLVIGGTCREIPKFTPENVDQLGEFARAHGCLTVLNHPFWIDHQWRFDHEKFTPDAMDIMSMNIDSSKSREILDKAIERNMQLVAASDAHDVTHVGLFHIELDNPVREDWELVREVRAGRCRTACLEDLWQQREQEIGPDEALAREVLADGGDLDEFHRRGGKHAGFFKRVAKGASYFPCRDMVGLRGSDFGIPPCEPYDYEAKAYPPPLATS